LNINNPTDCAKKFISNHKIGMILFIGIVLGNLMKKSIMEKENEVKELKHQSVVLHEVKNGID